MGTIIDNYKYLLWDIDGTVLDFLAAEKAAIRQLFKKYSLGDCDDEMLSDYSAINVRYWEALERGEMTKPQILVGRFAEFFEKYGIDTGLAENFNADYQLALGDTIVFCDDAFNILKGLKGKFVLIAVTNGTKAAQQKKLVNSGLIDIFDYIFISEDVGVEKPNRGYFDFVFNAVGIEDLKSAIIIGDSLTSDITGGINAGIDTCWYNPSGKNNTSDCVATFEICNLHEL